MVWPSVFLTFTVSPHSSSPCLEGTRSGCPGNSRWESLLRLDRANQLQQAGLGVGRRLSQQAGNFLGDLHLVVHHLLDLGDGLLFDPGLSRRLGRWLTSGRR